MFQYWLKEDNNLWIGVLQIFTITKNLSRWFMVAKSKILLDLAKIPPIQSFSNYFPQS